MPWLETDPVLERHHFVHDQGSGPWSMTELCARYGISRVTGYKWAERYQQNGVSSLQDHSRAPRSCPHHTPDELVELILEENKRHGWGPRKILKRLRTLYPERTWPARSTVFDILERHGRVQPRHRRRRWKHPGAVPVNTTAPNQIWTVDFKGQFLMRNGIYCYPLTILDHHSRFLLCCQYSGHVEVRRVSNAGCFRLHAGQIFLSQALNGEEIGLEQVADGLWNILYYDTLLGRFDEQTKAITGAPSLRGDL